MSSTSDLYRSGRLEDFYTVLGHLENGFRSQVFQCRCKETGELFAVKRTAFDPNEPRAEADARNEVEVMACIPPHPNVITFHAVFTSPGKGIDLVMDFLPGGELFTRIAESALHESDAVRIIRDILNAIAHVHASGVTHRDVKPENVLLSSRDVSTARVVLCDFGIGKRHGDQDGMISPVGTPQYSAPEMASLSFSQTPYRRNVDIWACGVVAYCVLVGYPPFYSEDPSELLSIIERGKVDFEPEDWSLLSSQAQDFCRFLLTPSPQERPTATAALKHPWLRATVQRASHGIPEVPLRTPGNVTRLRAGSYARKLVDVLNEGEEDGFGKRRAGQLGDTFSSSEEETHSHDEGGFSDDMMWEDMDEDHDDPGWDMDDFGVGGLDLNPLHQQRVDTAHSASNTLGW